MNDGTEKLGGHLLTLAVFTAVVLTFVGYILVINKSVPTFADTYTVKATVPSAALLSPGSRVTIAGTEVGKVTDVRRESALSPNAEIELEIDDERVTPLPSDSRIQLRTRSQVGENYVSITVGSDRRNTVPDGGGLGLGEADELVEVDQILSVLQGETRDRARTLLREFGDGLTGRGDELNSTIGKLSQTLGYARDLGEVLNERRTLVVDLVDHLGQIMSQVGDSGAAIQMLGTRGVVALRALGNRDLELTATLRELPSTLSQVRATTTTVGSVSRKAVPVVRNLTGAVRDLRPAIGNLAATARAGRGLMAQLDGAAPRLVTTVASLQRVADALPPALPEIENTLCEINPVLRWLEPYNNDLLDVLKHLGSFSNAYDATGHVARLAATLNENTFSGLPPEVLQASSVLLQSGLLTPSKRITYDPFMKPGEIGKTTAKAGQPTGPESLAASGYKYPRIEADC